MNMERAIPITNYVLVSNEKDFIFNFYDMLHCFSVTGWQLSNIYMRYASSFYISRDRLLALVGYHYLFCSFIF